MKKDVGGDVMAQTPLQSVKYDYNIRGWLVSINDNSVLDNSLTWGVDDLFSLRINRNVTSRGSTSLFNGNIS